MEPSPSPASPSSRWPAPLGVVLSKNAVNGAMCLLLCLAGIAGLFIQLHAYLLAFVLVLVYAGAVVALFLFIIMLLDMQGGQPWRFRGLQAFAGVVAAALLVAGLGCSPSGAAWPARPRRRPAGRLLAQALRLPALHDLPAAGAGDGFLLLIAMLGVIVLSRRTGEPEAPNDARPSTPTCS
jgi:NADH-quinone oxidoreductase subunit J